MKKILYIIIIALFVFPFLSKDVRTSPNDPNEDLLVVIGNNIGKVWVANDWPGGNFYDYPFSFRITDINGHYVKGVVAIGELATPEFYRYRFESSKVSGILNGGAKDGIIQCSFLTGNEIQGNISIEIDSKGEIIASISFAEDSLHPKHYEDGTFTFQVYNFNKLQNICPGSVKNEPQEVNTWGKVNFITAIMDADTYTYPVAFLADDNGDILYDFGSFLSDTRIKQAELKDVNGDGYLDVVVLLQLIGDLENEIEYIYYQMENGLFYSAYLEEQ